MTDKEYVIRATEIKMLDLIKPAKTPGILAYERHKSSRGLYECVIDARTWREAKEQIDNFYAD